MSINESERKEEIKPLVEPASQFIAAIESLLSIDREP